MLLRSTPAGFLPKVRQVLTDPRKIGSLLGNRLGGAAYYLGNGG